MNLQSRLTVFIAIGGMFALMAGIVYYASLDNVSLESVEFLSGTLKVTSVDTVSERARIEVTFDVRNPSDITFTIPGINYELTTKGEKVASGNYSTADVAMPGRVIFSSNEVVPLKSITYMVKDDIGAQIYNDVIDYKIDKYTATGTVIVESAWSIIEQDFSVELEHRGLVTSDNP